MAASWGAYLVGAPMISTISHANHFDYVPKASALRTTRLGSDDDDDISMSDDDDVGVQCHAELSSHTRARAQAPTPLTALPRPSPAPSGTKGGAGGAGAGAMAPASLSGWQAGSPQVKRRSEELTAGVQGMCSGVTGDGAVPCRPRKQPRLRW